MKDTRHSRYSSRSFFFFPFPVRPLRRRQPGRTAAETRAARQAGPNRKADTARGAECTSWASRNRARLRRICC